MKRTHEEIIEELRKRMEMYDKPEEECFIQGVITGLSISSNLVKDDEFLLSILENGKFYHFLSVFLYPFASNFLLSLFHLAHL